MSQSRLSAIPFLKPSTKEKPRIHAADLLNPFEVEKCFDSQPANVRDALRGKWLLVGGVNEDSFSDLNAGDVRHIRAHLQVIPTLSGAPYLVIIFQMEAFQHRFVLPMFDPRVHALLTDVISEPFNVNLESTGNSLDSILYSVPLPPEYFITAKKVCQHVDQRRCKDYLDELPFFLRASSEPVLIPSLNERLVEVVDVSILLPTQLGVEKPDSWGMAVASGTYRH